MKYPTDSIQDMFSEWWVKDSSKEIKKGDLIYAFVPYVDQIPLGLTPIGRKKADQHDKAIVNITPLYIDKPFSKENLPVAALSLHGKERWTVYRAKKRPCLVLRLGTNSVDNKLRLGMPKRSTSPTIIVAPYYGADKNGKRAGYNPLLIDRIRQCEYSRFFWDILPLKGAEESILRFDHIQPIGSHYHSYEHSGYRLSDEVKNLVLDDWLKWFFYGGLPGDCFLYEYMSDKIE